MAKSTLPLAISIWGGATICCFLYRRLQRYKEKGPPEIYQHTHNPVQALEYQALHNGLKVAMVSCTGETLTWSEYYRAVNSFARALLEYGTTAGVAIHAFNEPRWFVACLGGLAAGWTCSGIYLTNTYTQANHILSTSEVKVLVLESADLLRTTYQDLWKDHPELVVVLLNGSFHDARAKTWDEFMQSNQSAKLVSPGDLAGTNVASLVYTSGTTGHPKAVELTLSNIHSVCAKMHTRIPQTSPIVVSYLPLSHIAASGIDIFSSLYAAGQVHFADANALKGSLKDTLVKVRPTLFFGVPRVWEKMAAAMQEAAAKSYSEKFSGGVLKSIGTAAKYIGGVWWDHDTPEIIRCSLVLPFGFFKLLTFRKVRRGCGLDRCQYLYTGAAPLSTAVLTYLRSLDMPILEVYGMSESGGAIAVCGPNDCTRPLGACGKALPDGELKIAEDGEILWRANNNMVGYKNHLAATTATLSQGFLHTGDIGKVLDGYLFITGRKKDLIITAGGENIAPSPIEQSFLFLLKAGHVVLIGDMRKFLTILIAPAEDTDAGFQPKDVESALEEYNTNHAKSRAQRVQKAHILEHPFTVQTGELTPTMKLKRAFVVRKFANEIEAMYQDASTLVGYSSMNIGNLESALA